MDMPTSKTGRVTINATDDIAPPAGATVGVPQTLALTTGIGYSSSAPTAYINATWTPPETSTGALPAFYTVQVSTNSTFTASGTLTVQASTNSARIEGLLPNTLYYVRVRAFSAGLSGPWTAASSITTATDTVAAGVPTSVSATWIGIGDLLVAWTNPTEANLKDVEIRVRASSGGTIYRTTYSASGRFLYTLAMNLLDTANVGDPSLYVELRSRTFSNVLGTTVNTGLVTKSAPATPTGVTQSWSGDTGTAGADLIIAWTNVNDAAFWSLGLDAVTRRADSNRYTYTLETNRIEHSGTADPSISYSLWAIDGFGQSSTAVSGTATNAAPPTPSVVLTAGFSILIANVGGVRAADFAVYEFVWKRDGTTVRTQESPASEQQYEMSAAADDGLHSWTVVVRQKDLFNQFSSTVTSSAVVVETLTIAGLRAGAAYTDSESNGAASLAVLKDGNTTGPAGVNYNP